MHFCIILTIFATFPVFQFQNQKQIIIVVIMVLTKTRSQEEFTRETCICKVGFVFKQ